MQSRGTEASAAQSSGQRAASLLQPDYSSVARAACGSRPTPQALAAVARLHRALARAAGCRHAALLTPPTPAPLRMSPGTPPAAHTACLARLTLPPPCELRALHRLFEASRGARGSAGLEVGGGERSRMLGWSTSMHACACRSRTYASCTVASSRARTSRRKTATAPPMRAASMSAAVIAAVSAGRGDPDSLRVPPPGCAGGPPRRAGVDTQRTVAKVHAVCSWGNGSPRSRRSSVGGRSSCGPCDNASCRCRAALLALYTSRASSTSLLRCKKSGC